MMNIIKIVGLLLWVLSSDGALYGVGVAPQVPMEVTLKPRDNAEVGTSRIYLRDIMQCRGYSEICEDFYSVDLGEAPKAGKQTWVSLKQLQKILSVEFPGIKISYEGKKRIQVKASFQELSPDTMRNYLQEFASLENLLPQSMTVSHFQTPNAVKAREGVNSYKIGYLRGLNPHSKSWLRRATTSMVRVAGELVNSFDSTDKILFQAMIRLRVKLKMPVLTQEIAAGVMLKPEHVEMRETDLIGAPGAYIKDLAMFSGAMARRNLIAGMPVRERDVKILPLVKSQSNVEIVQENAGMEIRSAGKSLQNGSLGDRVQIELSSSRKRVAAVVVGKNSVRIVK